MLFISYYCLRKKITSRFKLKVVRLKNYLILPQIRSSLKDVRSKLPSVYIDSTKGVRTKSVDQRFLDNRSVCTRPDIIIAAGAMYIMYYYYAHTIIKPQGIRWWNYYDVVTLTTAAAAVAPTDSIYYNYYYYCIFK
jgi:hypothetical protein